MRYFITYLFSRFMAHSGEKKRKVNLVEKFLPEMAPIHINSKELFLLTLFKCQEPLKRKGVSVRVTLKGKIPLEKINSVKNSSGIILWLTGLIEQHQ